MDGQTAHDRHNLGAREFHLKKKSTGSLNTEERSCYGTMSLLFNKIYNVHLLLI